MAAFTPNFKTNNLKLELEWILIYAWQCVLAQIGNNISGQNHSLFVVASCLWIPDDLWHHAVIASKSPTIQNSALYRYFGCAFFWQELTANTCMVDCSRTYIYFTDMLEMSWNYEGSKRTRSFKSISLSRRYRLAVLYRSMSLTQMKPLSDTFCHLGNEPRMTIPSARFYNSVDKSEFSSFFLFMPLCCFPACGAQNVTLWCDKYAVHSKAM